MSRLAELQDTNATAASPMTSARRAARRSVAVAGRFVSLAFIASSSIAGSACGSPAASRGKTRQRPLSEAHEEPHRAHQRQLHGGFPVLESEVEELPWRRSSGVGDEDVNPSEPLDGGLC